MQSFEIIKRPPRYVVASILCSFGGFLFGIDTGIIGPVTVMKYFKQSVGSSSPTIHGLIVSSILIPAAISSFFAGRLADALGRRWGIAIGSLIFAIGAALEAASVHIGMFVAGRVIEGIGEGLYLGTLIVYICEISPSRHRGALSSWPQLLTTLGLTVGFFTCYGTANMGSTLSWRLPFILLTTYSLLFTGAVLTWLPDSPRWLILRGRESEAVGAWELLDVLAADREKMSDEYATPTVEVTNSGSDSDGTSPVPSGLTAVRRDLDRRDGPKTKRSDLLDVFSAESRPRLFLAVFMMGMQQLSGIDGVLYYAPLLFQQAGLSSEESSFLASGVSAIVIFAVTIPAIICADRWGRRTNTISGGLGMAGTMFLMGGLYAGNAVHSNAGAGRWIVIVTIYIYTVLYCVSWAVGMKIYAAEIQPQRTRASATNIAHGSNWLTNFLVALVTPTLLAQSSYGAYFLFGSCTFATAVVCWMFMPETRGRNLDEIEEAFRSHHNRGFKGLTKAFQGRLLRMVPSPAEV